MTTVTLPGLPGPLVWTHPPVSAWSEGDRLEIMAGAQTDIFTDPAGTAVKDDSPRLLFTPEPLFTLSAHVSVDFASTFDAGVLLLYAGAEYSGKLCFEFSPQGEPMIVSVVTNGVSDDCNSVALSRRDVFLRISCLGPAFAFHYSQDGASWRMVRYFRLHRTDGLMAGFSSQSPTGPGCRAVFDQITYRAEAISDLRSGA